MVRCTMAWSCIHFLSILAIHAYFVEACQCDPPPNLQGSYHQKDAVMKVKVLGSVFDGSRKDIDRKRIHVAKVLRDYKGTTDPGTFILIQSPAHSCGVILSKGRWMVSMNAIQDERNDMGVYTTEICSFYRKMGDMAIDQTAFLNSRMICDDMGQCICGDGSDVLNCDVPGPCRSSICPYHNVTCKVNKCGESCTAEWTDENGTFVC